MNAAGDLGAVRITPARLDVAMPYELPEGARDSIARAMAGEAWLNRMGLEGILTGIAGADMKTFEASVERLAGMLRYAREQGVVEGRTAADSEARVPLNALARDLALQRERETLWRVRVWGVATVGVFVGAALMAIVASV